MSKIFKRILIVFAVVLGLFVFLVAPRMTSKPDTSFLTGVYAHRGYFDNENGIPENSMPAFQKAIDANIGIELDVALSSDGVAMVFHDKNLERLCGIEGNIWEYTSEELQQMKLLDTEYTIPTLSQVLQLIDGKVPLIAEHKMDLVDTAICESSYELLKNYKGKWCIKSFDPRALLWYKSNAPEVVRGQLAEEFWHKEEYAGKPLYTALSFMVGNVATRPDFISYNYEHKDNISVKLCRLLGADTACWTVKTQQEYEELKNEFDIVLFDEFEIVP